MDGKDRPKRSEHPDYRRSKKALATAIISILVSCIGNTLLWCKTEAEITKLRAESKKIERDDSEREQRSAREWLELIKTSDGPEYRVLALKWLCETTPYPSIRKLADDELRRIPEEDELKKRKLELLEQKAKENTPAVSHKLRRVEEAQKVLRDIFGPLEKAASGRDAQ